MKRRDPPYVELGLTALIVALSWFAAAATWADKFSSPPPMEQPR